MRAITTSLALCVLMAVGNQAMVPRNYRTSTEAPNEGGEREESPLNFGSHVPTSDVGGYPFSSHFHPQLQEMVNIHRALRNSVMRTPHYPSLDEDPFSMFLPPRPWFVLERPNFSFFPNRSPFDIMPPMGDMGFDLGSIFNRRPMNKAPEGFVKVNETITEGNGGLRIKHTIWEKKNDGPNKMHAIIETTEVISPKEAAGDETSEEDKKENDRRSAEESNVERENEKPDEASSNEKKDIEENEKSEESEKKESEGGKKEIEEKNDKEETSESKVNEKEEESNDKKPEENKEELDKSIEKKNESEEIEKSTEATPEKDEVVKKEEEEKAKILESSESTPKPAENEITDKIEAPSTPEVTIKDN